MRELTDTRVSTYPRDLRERFVTALRGVSEYQVIKFEICDELGNWHVGETVETPKITGDNYELIMKELEQDARALIMGKDFESAIFEIRNSQLTGSSKAAIDIALNGAHGTGAQSDFSIATDVTIPVTTIDKLPSLISDRVAAGFTHFKIKANQEPVAEFIEKLQLISLSLPSDYCQQSSCYLLDCGTTFHGSSASFW